MVDLLAEVFRSKVLLAVLGVIALSWLFRVLARGYAIRRRLRGLHGPPHSWIWGHLRIMGEAIQEVPSRSHPHVIPGRIAKKYGLGNYFYIDLWPFNDPIFYILDADIAQQVTVETSLPKYNALMDFLIHLAGPGDIVSSNGEHWKKWRQIFNPGFASGHLMTLVPAIVNDSIVFTEKLAEHAEKGEVFRLEEDATRLTVDIIGKVTLDLHLGTQRGENELVTAFREQVTLLPNDGFLDPLKMWWPMGIYKRWRNSRIMNRYLDKVLDERFEKQRATEKGNALQKKERKRVTIDLALQEYQKLQAEESGQARPTAGIDESFKRAAITQIRTFIFAGHDTTSSTICYAAYMLSKNPSCLTEIRKEHDSVLGPIEGTADKIKNDPYILNKLQFTNAVIRETLRLWPAASSTRTGFPGYKAYDPKTGEPLETEDMLVWVLHFSIQRDEALWGPTAKDFDPSRFMPENASKVPENGWRAFERGPRNCIGQDLALLEARIILALTMRSFDFQAAFESLHELANDGSVYAKDEAYRTGRQDLDGEEAYPVLLGTAKPREGMPMRVKMVR